jgi:hypothetical protein
MNLVDYIMSKKSAGGANSVELQSIGKAAAKAYVENGTPLNDTVSEMAKEAGLNYEQIKRAAEFANNETFLIKFRQPYEKNVAFPVADASVISRNIHSDAVPVQEKTASRAWTGSASNRYVPGGEGFSLEKMLGVKPLEKRASTGPSRNEVIRSFLSHKDKLAELKAETEVLEARFLAKVARLNREVHQEIVSGTEPWAIGAAVVKANPSAGLFSIIASELRGSMDTSSMHKMAAGYELIDDNPVTGLVQDLEAVSQKLLSNEDTSQRTRAAIEEMLTLLRGQPDTNPTVELFSGAPIDTTEQVPSVPQPAPEGPGASQPMPQ